MSSSQGRLSSSLFELSETILIIVEESEDFHRQEVEVSKRVVDLDYSPSSRSLQTSHETTTRSVWSPETPSLLVERAKELELYDETLAILNDRLDDEAEFYLNHFLRVLISANDEEFDRKILIDLVDNFTSQIEDSPFLWHPIIFIEGVSLEPDSISLPNEVTLRRPVEEDLEYEKSVTYLPRSPFKQVAPDIERRFSLGPDSVLDFSIRAAKSDEVSAFVHKYIGVLKLFDVGSINILSRQYNPEAVTPAFSQPGDYPSAPFRGFNYTISNDQVENLGEFTNQMLDHVSDKIVSVNKDTPITIAFDRYSAALDEPSQPERQLTSAIMSLEALFLKENERGELSERLSRRTALLLSQFNRQPNEVGRKLREAYQIRSQYVHGSKLDEDADISSLTESVMDYTRRSIVTFLQLDDENGKNKLLSKIDNSSLNPDAYPSLEEYINGQCNI